ncbi:MAG TPA: M23 family metallopeptidase [Pyrinomonadaceae bacterium]|nr:M23 family metallopeptidase [Pyrinomonadaceae bacterium]
MSSLKLRILLCVVWLVILAIVSLAINYSSRPLESIPPVAVATPNETPTPVADAFPAATPAAPPSFVGQLNLIIPVAGVRPDQLLDTFADARSEGRTHDAIDIPAPAETPVLAATDGQILKLFQSERGGTTIYQLAANQELVFYYAHLSRYADGLAEGNTVHQGQVIAYVGDTGNAGADNYHLHFSIAAVSDPKRYWEGTNINPYPLLRR